MEINQRILMLCGIDKDVYTTRMQCQQGCYKDVTNTDIPPWAVLRPFLIYPHEFLSMFPCAQYKKSKTSNKYLIKGANFKIDRTRLLGLIRLASGVPQHKSLSYLKNIVIPFDLKIIFSVMALILFVNLFLTLFVVSLTQILLTCLNS